MPDVLRHDAIRLHDGVSAPDFERFVEGELFPHFRERYRGSTRTSIADLAAQSLLQEASGEGRYLWVTEWDGPAAALEVASRADGAANA